MKKLLLFSVLFVVFETLKAQQSGDHKIIITLKDTANIYSKVRASLEKNDFVIKEALSNKDSIITQPRPFKKISGWSVATIKFTDNSIIISGVYGLKNIHSDGFANVYGGYDPIVYYSSSRGWKVLMQIASNIEGETTFAK